MSQACEICCCLKQSEKCAELSYKMGCGRRVGKKNLTKSKQTGNRLQNNIKQKLFKDKNLQNIRQEELKNESAKIY